jgi:hypothetical protein
MKPTFQQDLKNEMLLGKYLDEIYAKKFEPNSFKIERILEINQQYSGIDIILTKGNKTYFIDEKAQLSYLNKKLPTFAFELSYLKNGMWKVGWLFDKNKKTDIYFLVTEIFCSDPANLEYGISSVKITALNRNNLIDYLSSIGLTEEVLMSYEKEIRQTRTAKKKLKELNDRNEGNLQITNFLIEQPVNLVLKLDNLVLNGIAKVIYDVSHT